MAQNSEWEKTWAKVIKDPLDFSSWESLVKLAEGVKSLTSDQDKQNLRTVYDHFLGKFPLLFGYWKKYADWEALMAGPDAAVSIYERGVASIHNSVDLWVFYLSYTMEKAFKSPEETRQLFERVDAVGLDFLSHPFWDKYIEFEQGQMNSDAVLAILERIIQIPLHQYARYYEKYSNLLGSVPTRELVSESDLQELSNKIQEENPDKSQEEIDNLVRQRIFASKSEIHQKTKKGVQERWVYESGIKRSYFHVKPLDDAQKTNWKKYLDYEEEQGDLLRIYALYERCLIPCAQYEEFWHRYAMYLLSKGDMDRTFNVFVRATSLFVHPRSKIRISYSSFLEEIGQIDEARGVFTGFLEKNSGHLEMTIKYAYFESRQGNEDKAEEILSSAAESAAATEEEIGMYLAHKIKLSFKRSGDKNAARNLFKDAFEKAPGSKFIWIHAFTFELNHPDESTATELQTIWESVYASPLDPDAKVKLAHRYADYMLEYGYPVAHLNRLEIQISYLNRYIEPATPNKKRPSVSTNGTHKSARLETDS